MTNLLQYFSVEHIEITLQSLVMQKISTQVGENRLLARDSWQVVKPSILVNKRC